VKWKNFIQNSLFKRSGRNTALKTAKKSKVAIFASLCTPNLERWC